VRLGHGAEVATLRDLYRASDAADGTVLAEYDEAD
jgi:hypothetical protein